MIKTIETYALNLPMKQSFSISGGSVGEKNIGAPHVYVKITDENGLQGWGEARPSHRWSYETPESVVSTIEHYIKPSMVGLDENDLIEIHSMMENQISSGLNIGQPIAKAAVDTALHDLIGKQQQKTLGQLWFGKSAESIDVSYLISTSDPQAAASKAEHAVESGYSGVDVKIGLNPKQDIEILEAVKSAAPKLYFRVDANQAYDMPQAVKLLKEMERIGIHVFEQPLKANDLLGHQTLRQKTSIPIALDESIWSSGDLLQAIRLQACDTVVIKLTKMGGLKNAKLCGEIAKAAGLGLLGGGLTESTLGLNASAQLFSYLGIEIPVDLNGPIFLQDDPVQHTAVIQNGSVRLSNGYGIGCEIDDAALKLYQVKPNTDNC